MRPLLSLTTIVTATDTTLATRARDLVVLLAVVCALAGAGAFLGVWIDQRWNDTRGAHAAGLVCLAVFVVALVLLAGALVFAKLAGVHLATTA